MTTAPVMSRLPSSRGRIGGGVTNRRQGADDPPPISRPHTTQGPRQGGPPATLKTDTLHQARAPSDSASQRAVRPSTGAQPQVRVVPKLELGRNLPSGGQLPSRGRSSYLRCEPDANACPPPPLRLIRYCLLASNYHRHITTPRAPCLVSCVMDPPRPPHLSRERLIEHSRREQRRKLEGGQAAQRLPRAVHAQIPNKVHEARGPLPIRSRPCPYWTPQFPSLWNSAAHREKSREWNVSKQKWNLS